MRPIPDMNDRVYPLVSITVHNYNYGPYLRTCLESLFSQTYPNIEICFSDNASTDDSWNIALEFAQRYQGCMTVTRNRVNFGSDANWANCHLNVRGKYMLIMCSDDALMPECVDRCVSALEANPTAGFAMVHRFTLNEQGERIEEPPFYRESCLIPGPEQAAVYMMASVNPSISQNVYNRKIIHGKGASGGLAERYYGNRIMDFNICCESPMVYIHEPLLLHRLHARNDSTNAAKNLMEIVGPYMLQYQFAEIATLQGLSKVADRLPASLDKLGRTSLRYCARALVVGQDKLAFRYLNLAKAIVPEIENDPWCQKLSAFQSLNSEQKFEMIRELSRMDNLLSRSISYEPPPGSTPLRLS
jgi:glycosyltransferase involved in cell wall biosynthesis